MFAQMRAVFRAPTYNPYKSTAIAHPADSTSTSHSFADSGNWLHASQGPARPDCFSACTCRPEAGTDDPNLSGLVKRHHAAAVDNNLALVHAVQGVHWLLPPARPAPSTTWPPRKGALTPCFVTAHALSHIREACSLETIPAWPSCTSAAQLPKQCLLLRLFS